MEFRLRPLGFIEFFYKTTIIRQLTKWNESKIEKIVKNRGNLVEIFTYDCKWVCVCVCVWVIVAYYYVYAWVAYSEGTNPARCFNRI